MRLITLFTIIPLLFGAGFAHGQSLMRADNEEVVQKIENGEINWTRMEISAYGYADPNQSIPDQIKAAGVEAQINLLAVLDKVTINSTTIVKHSRVVGDLGRRDIAGILPNPRLSEPQEVTVGGNRLIRVLAYKSIKGALARKILPPQYIEAEPPQPPEQTPVTQPPAPVKEETYTGLIIDATGTGVWPGLLPKILAQGSSRVIYGPGVFDPKAVIDGCAADYAWAVEEARKRPRVGKNPLIIQALSTSGETYKVDLVISPDDAVKIYRADLKSHFLKDAKVVIVCGS